MGPEKTRLAYLQERKEAVYENLRDLNFEHQAGKLPDQDYQSLKASLEEEAAGHSGGDGADSNRPLLPHFPAQKEREFETLSESHCQLPVSLFWLIVSTFASAQTLTGTLKNGTTGKPAAGDDVILIKLGQGMEEAARTKTDASGHFSFNLPDAGPHLIRAIHQGVTYHRMAPPGTTSVEWKSTMWPKKLRTSA